MLKDGCHSAASNKRLERTRHERPLFVVTWASRSSAAFAAPLCISKVIAMTELIKQQQETCSRCGAEYEPSSPDLILGISRNFSSGIWPLNGLRHPQQGQTCGWYLWAGEQWSEEEDFFRPLHVQHLLDARPEVAKYLGLAPGWRFLLGPDYEDVWFDSKLLEM